MSDLTRTFDTKQPKDSGFTAYGSCLKESPGHQATKERPRKVPNYHIFL